MTGQVMVVMQTFFAEARALLEQMEHTLLQLEQDAADAETLNALFRAVHTIKGSAGLFGLDDVVGFSHEVESMLDRVRGGELALDGERVALLLQCRDHLGRLLDSAVHGDAIDDECRIDHERLLAAVSPSVPAPAAPPPAPWRRDAHTADDPWHISVRFGADLFRKGLSPVPVLRHLRTLGELAYVATVADALPAATRMDPESCYLGLEIRLCSNAPKAQIEDAFEFVQDDCDLRLLPPGSQVDDYLRLIDTLPGERVRLGEILLDCGAITERELQDVLSQQHRHAAHGAPLPVGELMVTRQAAAPEVVQAALGRQQELRARHGDAQLVRVQAAKLDGLIDRVGELVIASAGVVLMAADAAHPGLQEAMSGMARLVEDIRDDAMRLRMVAIGETFGRFRRLVRDVGRSLDKDVELLIEGADTELDKTLVEGIAEPLTHLVRNAIDHGIEPVDLRRARGKPARGRIRLAARHEAGHVVIEVGDDGGGLDRERILAKARERGLVHDSAALPDSAVWNLICLPGFSTAAQVTDLSGRGVGMDVVRGSVEALRGRLEIHSQALQGTCFRIRLPLTLAIIDGFLMTVAGSHCLVPLERVLECVELPADAATAGYLNLRGQVLPLLRLREAFALPGVPPRRESVVVVQHLDAKVGLVVDALEGERQAVIKPLGALFCGLVGISGTTILASGAIALVLDVAALLGPHAGPISTAGPGAGASLPL